MPENKKLPKIAILTIVLLGSFLLTGQVFASYTIGSLNDNTTQMITDKIGVITGQDFTAPADTYVNFLQLKFGNQTENHTGCNIIIKPVDDGSWCPSGGNVMTSNEISLTEDDFSVKTFTWSQALIDACPLVSGDRYILDIAGCSDYNQPDLKFWGDSASNYAGGSFGSTTIALTPVTENPSMKDLYFALTLDGAGSSSSIWFDPAPSSTCDWEVPTVKYSMSAADISSVSTTGYTLRVAWGIAPDFYDHIIPNTDYDYFRDFTSLAENVVYTDQNMINLTPLVSGYTYYARAYICNTFAGDCDFTFGQNTANILAQSDEWVFITPDPAENVCPDGKVLTQSFTWPFATTTDNVTCDPSDGLFQEGWCNFWQYMLVPNQSTLLKYKTLKDTIATKPPFGYFTVYQTQLNSISTTTSSTIDLVLGSSYNNITYELRGISIFTTLFNGVTWLIWLLFGFWVFNRFRHFKF